MNLRLTILIILFVSLFLLRIQATSGLSKKAADPELEELASNFVPLRDFLSDKINQLLPQPQAALLSGMLLGVKEDLPSEFKKNLRQTSTIHIVVVSGQNLSLVAGFAMSLASILGRKKTIFLSLVVIVVYAFLTGLQIPVIRAAIMVAFASIAQLFGRENQAVRILSLTAAIMLIYQPNWLLSVSFQLSFLATFGVVVVAPLLIDKLHSLPSIIREDLAVSIAAFALTWPIIALNFHQASLVGILVNSLILWTVPLIMIGGIFSLTFGIVNLLIGQILSLFPGVLLTYFVYVVDFFGQLPLSSIYVGRVSPPVWIGYYLILMGIFLALKKKAKVNSNLDLLKKGG